LPAGFAGEKSIATPFFPLEVPVFRAVGMLLKGPRRSAISTNVQHHLTQDGTSPSAPDVIPRLQHVLGVARRHFHSGETHWSVKDVYLYGPGLTQFLSFLYTTQVKILGYVTGSVIRPFTIIHGSL